MWMTLGALLITGWITVMGLLAAPVTETMPLAQQNALLQKYCAVCHTDAMRNGGLTLEHFDAAEADPTLAAMLVSKMKGGAFGAAGIPLPDKPVREALVSALTAAAAGAHQWTVRRKQDVVTASMVRDLPGSGNDSALFVYRLAFECNTANARGTVQLSWAPRPELGTVSAAWDGGVPVKIKVDRADKVRAGAALVLYSSESPSPMANFKVPLKSLAISDLFPQEAVTFLFDTLPQDTRQALSSCFSGER